jgi:hypothetical protein
MRRRVKQIWRDFGEIDSSVKRLAEFFSTMNGAGRQFRKRNPARQNRSAENAAVAQISRFLN